MKKILLILLVCCFSCKTETKKESVKTATPVELTTIKEVVPEIVEEITEEVIEEVEIDNSLISIKRKPCSGDCPEFEVVISKDSILSYKGIASVSILGEHTLKLTDKQFQQLSDRLAKITFSEYKTSYGAEASDDFPETVITQNKKNITIKLWKDAPEDLIKVYTFIEDLLYDQKYLEE